MKILEIIVAVLVIVVALAWLGLQVKPRSFPPYSPRGGITETVPLPAGLPAPVERFYRSLYGDAIPVIHSVVITGRGNIQPVLAGPKLPARFIFVHEAGKAYRHYFESTWFGLPFLTVNEGIADGQSFFEAPIGNYHNDPNTNQGANLALWAEAGWFPSLWLTDPRARWQAVDDETAILFVPYEDGQESFVVRFDPQTGMINLMEAMRYRTPGETTKHLWLPTTVGGAPLPVTKTSSVGAAMWLDQGKPWATFTLEDIVFNVDVAQYVRGRGR